MRLLPARLPMLSRRLLAALVAIALGAVPLIAAATHQCRCPCAHDDHGCETRHGDEESARRVASPATDSASKGACGACALLASLAGTALAPIAAVATSFDLTLSFQASGAPRASIALHAPLSRGPPLR